MSALIMLVLVPVGFLFLLASGTNSGKEKSKSLNGSEALLFAVMLAAAVIAKLIG